MKRSRRRNRNLDKIIEGREDALEDGWSVRPGHGEKRV